MGKQAKKPKPKAPALNDLSGEYWELFLTCKVKDEHLAEVKTLVSKMVAQKKRYEAVATAFGTMPWWYVAITHAMEAGMSFNKHQHNGDPLTARTVQVPKDRPKDNPKANPKEGPSAKNPYTWEESATDAFKMKGLDTWHDWSIKAVLYKLESFNGWGYRWYHAKVLSPYLWSYTNHYTAGKYAADGKWSATLVSKQPGAAAIMKVMIDQHLIVPYDYMGDFPEPSKDVLYA